MAEVGVPDASGAVAVGRLDPLHRLVVVVAAAQRPHGRRVPEAVGVGLVEAQQDTHVLGATRVDLPLVVLLAEREGVALDVGVDRVVGVLHLHGGLVELVDRGDEQRVARVRVAVESRPDHGLVEVPLVVGVRGRVDAHEPTAVTDPLLEHRLLLVGERGLARRVGEQHDVALGQALGGEVDDVLGVEHREGARLDGQRRDDLDRVLDRPVPEPAGARVHQDVRDVLLLRGGGVLGRGRKGDAGQQHRDERGDEAQSCGLDEGPGVARHVGSGRVGSVRRARRTERTGRHPSLFASHRPSSCQPSTFLLRGHTFGCDKRVSSCRGRTTV